MPDLIFPQPPTFTSVEEERLHRKQRLAAGFRLFAKFGFAEGVAGHITARDPGMPDHFWVNPFVVPFAHIRASDLILVNHDGEVVEGRHTVNRAAFAIHSQIHQARPDVVAAAHSHSTYGRALSTLGELLEPITQDVCAFYEDHALFDDYTGVVFDTEEGKRIAHALGDNKAAILRNHGLLTTGPSAAEAFNAMYWLEMACKAQVDAMAANTELGYPPDDVVAHATHLYNPSTRRPFGVLEWPAMLRLLDRRDPSWRS